MLKVAGMGGSGAAAQLQNAESAGRGVRASVGFLIGTEAEQALLLAVEHYAAADSDGYGIAVRWIPELARQAGLPVDVAKACLEELCEYGTLLRFLSPAGVPVWVLPDWDDEIAPSIGF